MSKNKEKLFVVIIFALLTSNIFLIGKSLNEKDQAEAELMNQFLLEEDKKEIEEEKIDNLEDFPSEIMVHIGGAVANPGVYKVSNKERIYDVLKLAGGATSDADLNPINLAKKLQDEEKIYIPYKGESENAVVFSSNQSFNNTKEIIVNINTADKQELMTLPGIGDKTADSIIQYRSENKFNAIEDIMDVSGIGEKKFQKIEKLIRVR